MDPTQYDYENNTILVKSSYDIQKDPEGWIVHELIHHKLRDVKDDGKEYPTNNIEKEAYISQFKELGRRGYNLDANKFPTLAPKFTKYTGEYAPTLSNYWKMANGTKSRNV